jgi:hypothetical protein
MPRNLKSIVSLNAGELSPLVDSRVDLAKYASGCRVMQNAVAQKYGGATRRPGLYYLGTSKYGDSGYTVRLQAFKLSTESNYCVEFGHEYCRFIKGSAYIMDGDYAYEIVSPYTALTVDAVPQVNALQVCQIGNVMYLTHPDWPPYKLTRVNDTNWTLAAVAFDVPALMDQNPSEITIAASGTTGTVSLTASAAAWVTATHYQPTNAVAVAGILYVCLVDHVSGSFAADLSAGYWEDQVIFDSTHIGSTWQLNYLRDANEVDYDLTGDGTSSTIYCLGAWEVRTYGVWSADITVERSDDYGTTWKTVRSITGRADRNVDLTGTAETNALYQLVVTNYAVPDVPGVTTPRVIFEAVDAFLPGLVKITAVTDSYHATATVVSTLYAAASVPDATPYWSEAAWSDFRGYPAAITAHEQRVIYGGSAFQPQHLWGTYISDIENFDQGDGTDAAAGFSLDIATVDNSPIRWLASGDDLIIGMSNAEWVASAPDSNQVLSATNFKVRQQSDFGSNTMQAVIVGDALIYVDRFGLTVRQFLFSIATSKYMSSDLTALAEHITYPGILRMDVQKQFEKYRIIWFIAGGQLLGLTYDLEHEVVAWHRHLGRPDKDEFVAVACVYGATSATADDVYVAVRRTVGASTYIFIEHMADRLWEHASFFDPAPGVWGQTWGGPAGADGTFQWYGYKPFTWVDDGSIPVYYLLDTGSGFSKRQDWFAMPYDSGTTVGSISAQDLGGALLVNQTTGLVTGNFAAIWMYTGNFCTGSSWRGSYGGYTGDTFVTYSSLVFSDLLPFVWVVVTTPTQRIYSTPDYPTPPGELITYCGNPMWGNPGDSAQEILSNQMTISQAAANGTAVAQQFDATTSIVSHDNSTNQTVGRISSVNVSTTVPNRTGYVLATFNYSRIPLSGGAPVTLSESISYPVAKGSTLSSTQAVPGLLGYATTCMGITYQDIDLSAEDFSGLVDGWYGDTTGGNDPGGDFGPPASMGMEGSWLSVDDFSGMADGVILTMMTGENWAGPGTFGQSDYAQCYDDFSSYPDGDLPLGYAGIGWAFAGTFGLNVYVASADDFSGYVDGTYDTLANLDLSWADVGTFGLNDYVRSTDDFSSYADGTYASLDGGTNWAGLGTFG